MKSPKQRAEEVETSEAVPAGTGDRFSGYGVMGMPFASGHILGLRRFPASSVGPGYRSVWHRTPDGSWTFYQDQPAELACTRYFSAEVSKVVDAPIEIEWTGETEFNVRVSDVEWSVALEATPVTRAMNAMGAAMSDRAWRMEPLLNAMSKVAGPALKVGNINLTGVVPNGQNFISNPVAMWVAKAKHAVVGGTDLGPDGALPDQAMLADFAIPQRGMFVFGRAIFTS
jgi:hypothetical protein